MPWPKKTLPDMSDNKYQQLYDDLCSYAKTQYDLLRLELLDKLTKIVTMLAVGAIAITLGLGAFIYLSLSVVEWLAPVMGGRALPLLIVCALFLIAIVIVIACKRKLFVEPLLRSLSAILFSNDDEDTTATTQRP